MSMGFFHVIFLHVSQTQNTSGLPIFLVSSDTHKGAEKADWREREPERIEQDTDAMRSAMIHGCGEPWAFPGPVLAHTKLPHRANSTGTGSEPGPWQ